MVPSDEEQADLDPEERRSLVLSPRKNTKGEREKEKKYKHYKPSADPFKTTPSAVEVNKSPLWLSKNSKNPSRRRSEPVTHPKVKPDTYREVDLEQENWPTYYEPTTIASDILRVAGIHPTLPPLNAHLKHSGEFEDMIKARKGRRKARRTE